MFVLGLLRLITGNLINNLTSKRDLVFLWRAEEKFPLGTVVY